MPRATVGRTARAVGAAVGGGLLVLGTAELLTRLDEPLPLFFWLPTLWGGAALVLVGVFGAHTHARRLVLVTLGAALGFLPSVWTLVMPLLSLALIFLLSKPLLAAANTPAEDPPAA